MLKTRIIVGFTVVLMILSVYTSAGLGNARTSSPNRDLTMSALGLKGQIDVRRLPTLRGPDMPATIPFNTQGTTLLRTGQQASLPDEAASQNVAVQRAFNGLTLADNVAVTGFLVTPPDVQIAVGPSNTLEMVNIVGAIFSKGGARETTFSLASFFNAGNDFLSDPKVLFDASSGRWFASVIDENTLSVSIAVSESSDATGSFCLFSIPSAPNFPDQPIIGVSNDKLVVSINLFSSHSFLGAQFFVLNKSQLTACSTSVDIFTSTPDRTVFSVHPVQSLTSTTTEFMVSTLPSRSGGLVFLYSVHGVPPGLVTVSRTALTVSTIDSPPHAVQLGSNLKLDTGDFRVQDAFWSNNALWLAHANACVPSGDTVIRSCIHLVELNTLTSSVVQDFNFGSSGSYLLYPALRPDARGNLLVIYGFSSASDFPGLKVTEQATTDAPNTLETPLLLQAGFGPVELTFGCSVTRGCRYGDYFSAAVDPSSPNVVWVAGEFGSGETFRSFGGGWATELGTITG